MTGDTDFTHGFTDEKGCYLKDDSNFVSATNDEISENLDELKQTLNSKPPRHLSIVQNSISSTILLSSSDFIFSWDALGIEKLGGVIYDGHLNVQLSVSRALGDWHMKVSKGSAYPLSASPELQATLLTEEDELLIMGCDGLWDVMSSQCALIIVRKELMTHNDPERCSRELVREALKRNTCDNLTVTVICFSHDPPPRIEIRSARVWRSLSAKGLNLLKGVLEGN